MAIKDQQSSSGSTKKINHLASKLLIVMAHEKEEGQVLQKLGFSVLFTGVGLLESTRKLTEFILTNPHIEHFVNIGTCGLAYGEGQVFQVEKVFYRGHIDAFLNQLIDLTLYNFESVKDHNSQIAFEKKINTAICGSADFTELGKLENHRKLYVNKVAEDMAWVADMELYALAQVCLTYKKRLSSFKVVSDSCDVESIKGWKLQLPHVQKQFVEIAQLLSQINV